MRHGFGLEIPEILEDVSHPERMAFIVYDMQVGILSQLEHGSAVLERVQTALEAARTHGLRVFFLRHMSLPTRMAGAYQLRQAMAWQRVASVQEVKPWFLRDSPGFQIAPELAPRDDEAVFDKLTMSAFEGTPLNIALRDAGLSSFAIVGIATEIGIEPTVRHGGDLGFVPVLIEDACGAGHPDAGRRAVDSLRFHGDAILTDVQGFRKALEQNEA